MVQYLIYVPLCIMVIEVLTLSFTFLVHMNADFGLFMISLFMSYEIKALCTKESKPDMEKFSSEGVVWNSWISDQKI